MHSHAFPCIPVHSQCFLSVFPVHCLLYCQCIPIRTLCNMKRPVHVVIMHVKSKSKTSCRLNYGSEISSMKFHEISISWNFTKFQFRRLVFEMNNEISSIMKCTINIFKIKFHFWHNFMLDLGKIRVRNLWNFITIEYSKGSPNFGVHVLYQFLHECQRNWWFCYYVCMQ